MDTITIERDKLHVLQAAAACYAESLPTESDKRTRILTALLLTDQSIMQDTAPAESLADMPTPWGLQ